LKSTLALKKVTIIGGGLSGLITAIQLIRANIPVKLYEKKNYPFHRVCGEYISNETAPFLKSIGLYPEELVPAQINQFQLTSTQGKSAILPLKLGGFGISRYAFDHWLYKKAMAEGVEVYTNSEVNQLSFSEDQFTYTVNDQHHTADVIIGAFGKRSRLDKSMNRSFIKKRSPYLGIKYHIKLDQPADLISLHNFKNGYCGISQVENGVVNLCYLSHRSNLKEKGHIKQMEEEILSKNPFLKDIFHRAEFLFGQPETINEISFETKAPIENHVLMCGDSAGMITPLCGNGMAMAIHSSKLLSELLIPYILNAKASRTLLEQQYTSAWRNQFAKRLWAGRQLQKLFGSTQASNTSVWMANQLKPVANYLVSKTHGKEF